MFEASDNTSESYFLIGFNEKAPVDPNEMILVHEVVCPPDLLKHLNKMLSCQVSLEPTITHSHVKLRCQICGEIFNSVTKLAKHKVASAECSYF